MNERVVIVAVSADGRGRGGRTHVRRQKGVLGLFLYFPLRFATGTDGELVIAERGGEGGRGMEEGASCITSRSIIPLKFVKESSIIDECPAR